MPSNWHLLQLDAPEPVITAPAAIPPLRKGHQSHSKATKGMPWTLRPPFLALCQKHCLDAARSWSASLLRCCPLLEQPPSSGAIRHRGCSLRSSPSWTFARHPRAIDTIPGAPPSTHRLVQAIQESCQSGCSFGGESWRTSSETTTAASSPGTSHRVCPPKRGTDRMKAEVEASGAATLRGRGSACGLGNRQAVLQPVRTLEVTILPPRLMGIV